MAQRWDARLLLATILSAATAVSSTGQDSQAVHDWIRSRAQRLATVEPSPNVDDLRPISSLIGDARVVALGEPSHGNHEPLAFRNRLFQFLVAEKAFTAIAIETGFAEAERIQAFVAGGAGTAEAVAREGLTYGFGQFDENVALIQWMRDHNSRATTGRKLSFFGVAVSLGGPRTATPTPASVEIALNYLRKADSQSLNRAIEESWRTWAESLRTRNPEEFSQPDHDRLTADIDDLIATFERRRGALVARTSVADYEWAYRNAIAAREADRMFRAMPPPERGRIPPAAWRQMEAGDEAMAARVTWILEREGPQGKVLVFAHNTHVQAEPLRGGVWDGFEHAPTPMGMRLRASLADRLRVIGLVGATSAEGMPFSDPGPDSIDVVLARAGVPRFVVDWRTAPESISNWLRQPHRLRSGGTFEVVTPTLGFDGIAFVDRLSPARSAQHTIYGR